LLVKLFYFQVENKPLEKYSQKGCIPQKGFIRKAYIKYFLAFQLYLLQLVEEMKFFLYKKKKRKEKKTNFQCLEDLIF